MIGFVDHFTMLALQEAWDTTVAGGYSLFRDIFNAKIPDALIQTAWTKLNAKPPLFRAAWTVTHETPNNTIVAVELMEEALVEGFFQNAHLARMSLQAPSTDIDMWNVIVDATVGIYIYSTDKDTVRVMNTFVLAAMISNTKWFLRGGVDNVGYLSSSDLGPESRLLPDGVNNYMRLQKWRFGGALQLYRPGGPEARTPKWITVADRSSFVGQVRDTDSRTTTDLEDTLPGGLDPES